MKKILSLILMSVFIFSFVGCQTDKKPVEAEKLPKASEIGAKTEDVPQGITVNEIDFERIAIEDLDSELLTTPCVLKTAMPTRERVQAGASPLRRNTLKRSNR